MKWVNRIMARPGVEKRDINGMYAIPAWGDFSTGLGTLTGRAVSVEAAIGLPAVWACVRVLAENIGSLPFILYRNDANGRSRATDSPSWRLLHDAPNPEQPAGELFEEIVRHLALYGNAFIYKMRDGNGRVVALYAIPPSRVRVGRIDGKKVYEITTPSYTAQPFEVTAGNDRDILHIRYATLDGLRGIAPITVERQSLALHLAQQEHAARFYSNSAMPSGVISLPTTLSPENARRLKENWESAHRGLGQAARVGLLQEGATFTPLDIPFADQQFIDQRNFGVQEVCRIFGVPPYMLGVSSGDSQTYANVEQQALHFTQFTLRNWARIIERSLAHDGDIIVDPSIYGEFLLDDLLRADTLTRYNAHLAAIKSGWLSPNEVREMENRNPVEGLDIYTQNFGKDIPPATDTAPDPTAVAIDQSDPAGAT